jgi:Flp pilus assembly pilin Flp
VTIPSPEWPISPPIPPSPACRPRTRAPWRILRDGRAVTALEYGIIAALVGLALLGIFSQFTAAVAALFGPVSNSI